MPLASRTGEVKYRIKGNPGADAYNLITTVSQVYQTATGTFNPNSFTAYAYQGKELAIGMYLQCWGSSDNENWTYISYRQITLSNAGLTVNVRSSYKYYIVRLYDHNPSTNIDAEPYFFASATIPVIKDGEPGAQGNPGAKMRMRTWASGTYYMRGVGTEEWYDVVEYEGRLYLCRVSHTASTSNSPISGTGYWEIAQNWTFIATQLLLAGKIVSDKITADLIDADGLTAKDITVYGSIRSGFTEGDSFSLEYSDNIVVPNPGSPGGLWDPYVTLITLPLAVASNIGRKITITVTQGEGMATVQFASGYETDIWENGEIVNTLTILGGETVELLAYGVNNVFKAWIVLSRTKPTVISAPTIKSGATCVKMQSINSSQAIKDDVTFVIIASTNSITVNLPTDAPEGRVLYIRSLNWGKVTFSGRIRFTDGTYAINNWSIEDSHPRMFIYDGTYWNEFFCSIIK